MNQIVPSTRDAGALMESVIAKGDLAKLTPAERSQYYMSVCESIGLNPLTQPFAYITLNSKLTLYATKTCTDQLRAIYKVSVEELTETERDGVFVVTAKVRNGEGRTDMAKGAVTIANLKGDALANAIMKTETKAKRRATLSICGLGMLDESEIETIPGAAQTIQRPAPAAIAPPPVVPPSDPETGELGPHLIAVIQTADDKPDYRLWAETFIAAVKSATTMTEANAWADLNAVPIASLKQYAPKMFSNMMAAFSRHRDTLADRSQMPADVEDAAVDDAQDQLNLLRAG